MVLDFILVGLMGMAMDLVGHIIATIPMDMVMAIDIIHVEDIIVLLDTDMHREDLHD